MNHHTSHARRGSAPVAELIYDSTCPNVETCRAALRAALAEAGLPPSWTEWDRDERAMPAAYRHYGSPTVLVDGHDVAAAPDSAAPSGGSCRLYASEATGKLCGAPSVQSIHAALAVALARPMTDALASDHVARRNTVS